MRITQADLEASRASMRGVIEELTERSMKEMLDKVNKKLKREGFNNIEVAPYHDEMYGDVYGIYIVTGRDKQLVETIRHANHVFPYLKEMGIAG